MQTAGLREQEARNLDQFMADVRAHVAVRGHLPQRSQQAEPREKALADKLGKLKATNRLPESFLQELAMQATRPRQEYARELGQLMADVRAHLADQGRLPRRSQKAEPSEKALAEKIRKLQAGKKLPEPFLHELAAMRQAARGIQTKSVQIGIDTVDMHRDPAPAMRRRCRGKQPAPGSDSRTRGSDAAELRGNFKRPRLGALPELDRDILSQVRSLGRYPQETDKPGRLEERRLAMKLRRLDMNRLLPETRAELEGLRLGRWVVELATELASIAAGAERTELDRRRALLAEGATLDTVKGIMRQPKGQKPNLGLLAPGSMAQWWARSGAALSSRRPQWPSCAVANAGNARHRRAQTPVNALLYDLAHELLMDMRRSRGGGAADLPFKCEQFAQFFAACRDAQQRCDLPHTASIDAQPPAGKFKPHQCARQLALIELRGTKYSDLPLDHAALLQLVRDRRAETGLEVEPSTADALQMAAERILQYAKDPDRVFANARFLNLRDPPAACGGRRAQAGGI